MTDPSNTADRQGAQRSIPLLPPAALFGFAIALLVILITAYFSYASLSQRKDSALRVQHTLNALQRMEGVLSSVKDAETGQRGYLLTGFESYLEPYNAARAALPGDLQRLRELLADNADQTLRYGTLAQFAQSKMEEMEQTVSLRRSGDAAGALAVVHTDRGKALMASLRQLVAEMESEERRLLVLHEQQWQDAAALSVTVTAGGSALLVLLVCIAAWSTSRSFRAREAQAWMRACHAELAARIQGEQRIDVLGEQVLTFLGRALGMQVGALYIDVEDGGLQRVAGYALPDGDANVVRHGSGLLGQAAKENRTLVVRDVPEGYLPVASSLGRGQPRQLLVAPASADGVVHAVIELGFFRTVDEIDREFMSRVSELLGIAVRSSKDHARLEALLEETQRQAEELQTQQEELRVTNEELEEQARALKESQARLESQQAELEAGNAQLEEHNQLLEEQRNRIDRSRDELMHKSAELERASRYKSEFLANMSHELRTPLNSTLILAKMLADNRSGNLTEEQVRFARTITSAGNDLLLLINDILDLSKIEAGKIDIAIEPVSIARAVEALGMTYQPLAAERGLAYAATIEPGTPERLDTDLQRLNQILRNLLSNALKFTERGQVALRVHAPDARTVAFEVRDTGIGIAEHQQALVFDAFRQADGSTQRKYGGTGLGLSISRDLARLLGGDVTLRSAAGAGSTFTLTLPRERGDGAPAVPAAAAPAPLTRPAATDTTPPRVPEAPDVQDDRDRLIPGARLILAIEDDRAFAAILRDLAHELGFQCVLAHTADDGIAAAEAYRPHAILLDMKLPDHSGLGVLDRLKHNAHTRHVPVHVVSVAAYAKEALELGAIGYALKPVNREQLVDALQRLEARFSQQLRRVLVVEDDERQRDSLRQLLGVEGVEITAVENAGAALQHLRETTYDCVVLDINLPDLSGAELLQRMAAEDDVSFPPVIVYTGHSLSADEEQALRRYSSSIIVKGVRSPERLLDEVTLFLHQVESSLPAESQRMLKVARDRESLFDDRRILIVEDDVRNVFALTSVLESKHIEVAIARNGREALQALGDSMLPGARRIDMVLMDIMMPEMDGLTAMREIRKRPEWRKLPIIALTAKAMKDDHDKCLDAGANDYIAKPLDVEKLLSLLRVWMPK